MDILSKNCPIILHSLEPLNLCACGKCGSASLLRNWIGKIVLRFVVVTPSALSHSFLYMHMHASLEWESERERESFDLSAPRRVVECLKRGECCVGFLAGAITHLLRRTTHTHKKHTIYSPISDLCANIAICVPTSSSSSSPLSSFRNTNKRNTNRERERNRPTPFKIKTPHRAA